MKAFAAALSVPLEFLVAEELDIVSGAVSVDSEYRE